MNKSNRLFLLISVLLIGILISCHEDVDDITLVDTSKSIDAKMWYEIYHSSKLNFAPMSNAKGAFSFKPDWGNALINSKNQKIVEVPLIAKGQFGYTTLENKLEYDETGNKKLIYSITKLIIETKGSNTWGFLMTIIPDKGYLLSTEITEASAYKNLPTDFCGYVLYHNLNGNFSNGWKFSNGTVSNTIKPMKGATFNSDTKGGILICYDTYLLIWYQDCTEWYTNGVYVNTTCGPGYIVMEPIYSECTYIADDNGGGGGSGDPGGYGVSTAEPYTPQSGDVFSKPNINSMIPQQVPNTCVTSMMEYVNHELCGGSINEGDYITDYLETYHHFVLTEGVASSDILSFLQRHFNTTNYSSVYEAIDNGNFVMADMYSPLQGSTHNVCITGYHLGGQLIFMDPEKGTFWEAPASEVGLNYIIGIQSCK